MSGWLARKGELTESEIELIEIFYVTEAWRGYTYYVLQHNGRRGCKRASSTAKCSV